MAKWNKYTYTNIFKKINNLSCYWAGFIMADGNEVQVPRLNRKWSLV